jgi:hypothetical protein
LTCDVLLAKSQNQITSGEWVTSLKAGYTHTHNFFMASSLWLLFNALSFIWKLVFFFYCNLIICSERWNRMYWLACMMLFSLLISLCLYFLVWQSVRVSLKSDSLFSMIIVYLELVNLIWSGRIVPSLKLQAGFDSWQDQGFFSLLWYPHQCWSWPILWYSRFWIFYVGIKWPDCETDHIHPSSACGLTSRLPLHLHGVVLRQRYSFRIIQFGFYFFHR